MRGMSIFKIGIIPVELGPIHCPAYLSEEYAGANQTLRLRLAGHSVEI
jgi:hypothetical protein